ncbi:MAG: hypothetical protein LAP13_02720 [Acidobacteriia bacterium]|nr:hypothetical protein [Terriglobia bacterium]
MPKTQKAEAAQKVLVNADPQVAATLTGIIYQARLFNRQARMNIPEDEVVTEVVNLWRSVTRALAGSST